MSEGHGGGQRGRGAKRREAMHGCDIYKKGGIAATGPRTIMAIKLKKKMKKTSKRFEMIQI